MCRVRRCWTLKTPTTVAAAASSPIHPQQTLRRFDGGKVQHVPATTATEWSPYVDFSEELDEAVALVEAEAFDDSGSSSFFSESLAGFLYSYFLDDLQSPEDDRQQVVMAEPSRPARGRTEGLTALLIQSILDRDDVWWTALVRFLVFCTCEGGVS